MSLFFSSFDFMSNLLEFVIDLYIMVLYNGYGGKKKMKKAIGVTIEVEIYDQIKKLADAEGRNLSNMVEFILRKYLEKVQADK